MKSLRLACVLLAGAGVWAVAEPARGPASGAPGTEKSKLVEGAASTNAPAPVTADTNALAALVKEEAALMEEAKDVTRRVTALIRPLWVAREQAVKQDKDLQAISRAIAEKEKELEAKLAEKYPDIAAKAKERDELTRQHSAVGEKLRDVRKKIDAIEEAIKKEKAEKKPGK